MTIHPFFSRPAARVKGFLSRDRNVILLLLFVTALTYVLCLPNQMFWDDDDFITKNTFIQDWKFWPNFFTHNVIAGNHLLSNYWRPVLLGIFAIEWHLWADWVWGWHTVSVLLHAAAGGALFFVVNILTGQRPLAILTALLWLVHPAHTEAVVYPNSLGDSLAMLFILICVWCYASFRRSNDTAPKSRWWWLALAAYPLAIMSKETGILLVAFIALADFFFLIPVSDSCKKAGRVLAALWPFILMAVGYILLRATVLNFSNSFNFYKHDTPFTTHFDTRLATFFRVISLDAGFIFTPYDLRVERTIDPAGSFLEWDVLWGMFLCLVLAVLAVRNWRKRPAVPFGILWFFTAIMPTSNLFVIINALVYEHFIYIALAGSLIAMLTLGLEWAKNETQRRIFFTAVLMLALAFAIRSAWRCTDWHTAVGFYEQLTQTAPKSYRVINNLAMAYAEHGIPDKAEKTYLKAIALDPTNAVAYHNLANIYRDSGRKELARQNYEKAIELQPSFIFSYKSLAQIYLDTNEYSKARWTLEKYLKMCDEPVYILNMLTQIAYREGAYDAARQYLQALLKINPGDQTVLGSLANLDKVIKK